MGPLNEINLYVNTARPGTNVLCASLTDPTAPDNETWVQDDKFLVILRFLQLSTTQGQPPTVVELDDTAQIVMGGRVVRNAGSLLFSACDFEQVIDGEDISYQATIDLHTANMTAALTGVDTLNIWVDIEVQDIDPDSDDNYRLTYQFPVTIHGQAYAGDTPAVSEGPAYPAPADVMTRQLAVTYPPMLLIGDASLGLIWGFYIPQVTALTVLGILLVAQDAPTGSALTVQLYDNGVAVAGSVATLAAAANAQKTAFGAPIDLNEGHTYTLQATAVGSATPGSNLVAYLIVQPDLTS